MLALGVEPRKIRIIVLQHLVLIAMSKLTAQRAILRPAFAIVHRSIIFHRTLAHRFIRTIHCRYIHQGLLLWWLRTRMIAPHPQVGLRPHPCPDTHLAASSKVARRALINTTGGFELPAPSPSRATPTCAHRYDLFQIFLKITPRVRGSNPFCPGLNFWQRANPVTTKITQECAIFLFSLDDAVIRSVLLSGFHRIRHFVTENVAWIRLSFGLTVSLR